MNPFTPSTEQVASGLCRMTLQGKSLVAALCLLVCVGQASAQQVVFTDSPSFSFPGSYITQVSSPTTIALSRIELTVDNHQGSKQDNGFALHIGGPGHILYFNFINPDVYYGADYHLDLSGVTLPAGSTRLSLVTQWPDLTLNSVILYGTPGPAIATSPPPVSVIAPVLVTAPTASSITPASTGTATATPLNTFVSQIIPTAGTPAHHTPAPAATSDAAADKPIAKTSTHQHVSAMDVISANADLSRTIALGHTGHIDQRFYALRNRSVRAVADGTAGIGLDVWTMGNYSLINQDATDVLHGYDSDSAAGTLGVEYMFSTIFSLGVSLGVSESDIDYDSDGGEIDSEGDHYGLYTHYSDGGLYGSILYSYGDLDMDMTRAAGYFGHADATSRAKTHTVEASIAYDFTHKHLCSGPVLQMRYDWVGVDGYTEMNAGLANLVAQPLDSESWSASAGWAVRYDGSHLSPFLSVSYEHEETSLDKLTVASAADSNLRVTQDVPSEEADYAALKAGLLAYITDAVHTQASYETMFFHDGVDYHSLNISLSCRF